MILDQQMKENEEKKNEFKAWIKEQGDIWKDDDEKTYEEIKEIKKKKKIKQKEIKNILDQQVKAKEEKQLNDLQLSPVEVKINKNILSSAFKVLGEQE